ncbi:MAG: hypothetical protein AAF940_10340 [Pseudomonadota bacterium]
MLFVSTAAQADDYWSGVYVGVGAGFSDLQERLDVLGTSVTPSTGITFNGGTDAPFATVMGGYRNAFGRVVFGAEFSYTSMRAEFTGQQCTNTVIFPCASTGVEGELWDMWRGRLSVGTTVDDKTLVSVNGGVSAATVAFTGLSAVALAAGGGAGGSGAGGGADGETSVGFNIGGSVERKLTERVSLRFEGIFDRVYGNDVNAGARANGFSGGSTASASAEQDGRFPIDVFSFQGAVLFTF